MSPPWTDNNKRLFLQVYLIYGYFILDYMWRNISKLNMFARIPNIDMILLEKRCAINWAYYYISVKWSITYVLTRRLNITTSTYSILSIRRGLNRTATTFRRINQIKTATNTATQSNLSVMYHIDKTLALYQIATHRMFKITNAYNTLTYLKLAYSKWTGAMVYSINKLKCVYFHIDLTLRVYGGTCTTRLIL